MKKILLTGANGMLATDFVKYCSQDFEIIACDRQSLDIIDFENVEKVVSKIKPDIILNCSAYTAVDDAEDIWKLQNFQINTLWVYNLAKVTTKMNIDFITISTDYVFDGTKSEWYNENDICNPVNEYGMSKYLGEKLAWEENKNTIIIRTSWLYGGWKEFKNFVNTMLKLSETRNELKVVNNQFGIPTFTKDLSLAIWEVIEKITDFRGKILQFSNSSKKAITWFDFASEIFRITENNPSLTLPLKTMEGKNMHIIPCSSTEFLSKAHRPEFSLMKNNSSVQLRDWKEGLRDYIHIFFLDK